MQATSCCCLQKSSEFEAMGVRVELGSGGTACFWAAAITQRGGFNRMIWTGVGVVMTDENDESYSMLLVCMICGLLLLCGVAAITQHPQWFRVPDDRLNQARGDPVLPQAATRRGFSAPKVAAPL